MKNKYLPSSDLKDLGILSELIGIKNFYQEVCIMEMEKVSLPIHDFYLYEEFETIVPIVSKFFISGGGHYEGVIRKRQITCYGKFNTDLKVLCDNCSLSKLCKNKEINLYISEDIDKFFYDWRDFILTEAGVIIKVNEKTAGVYCPALHSLFLTDWTHNKDTVKVALELLPDLLEILQKDYSLTPASSETWKDIKITLGSDPEFEQLVDFNHYQVVQSKYRGTNNEIGCDGSGYQIELRPAPSETPEGLVYNIKSLIRRMDVPISVAGDAYPLGAHIHFGFAPVVANKDVYKTIIKILDDFLGVPLSTLNGKARGSYARLSAYEEKSYGFEYRSLPSAFLHSPHTARIVFKIAYNLVKSLFKKSHIQYEISEKYINGKCIKMPSEKYYHLCASLTKKEYNHFIWFLHNFEKFKYKTINRNWGVKNLIYIDINLNDTWNNKFFKGILRKVLKRKLKENKINQIVLNITLYGLKKERGNVVAGFKSSIYETIPHPIFTDNSFTYGLPWEFRNETLPEDIYIQISEEISEDIISKLNNIL